ncbi:MAG: O-antigen ligase family protein [Polaromonas sp.]
MQQILTISVLVTGAILAALAASVSFAAAIHLTSRRTHGFFHLIFYAMVLMIAIATLLSARDLSGSGVGLEETGSVARHPLLVWTQPLVSLLLLTVAGERIVSYWFRREKTASASPLLLLSFIFFWLCTVAAPAFLGGHPFVSHDYAYTLVIGFAAVLATSAERDLAFRATRNALLLFMTISLLLIPIKPDLVLDLSYSQGLLPGVPRLAGLAAHAVSLGILAQLGLLCLLAYPYRKVGLNWLAWIVGLSVIFLAQSKTSWIAFFLCSMCIVAVRHSPTFWSRVGNPVRRELGIVSILIFMAVVLFTALIVMFGDLDTKVSSFFNSAQGAQLASLTGRDKIWAIAYEEWQRSPVFGYGPTIWDADFRRIIGMANATNAHNQFMDTLSRSGAVGAVALVVYSLVLLVLSVRYAPASRGLTLALFMALALRSISEVPFSLFGYGSELITHVLLLMSLGAIANDVRIAKAQTAPLPSRAVPSNLRPARKPLSTARIGP